MKKSTKKLLGGLVLVGSVIGGYIMWKRAQEMGFGALGMTENQARQARIVRQMAKWKGMDLTPKPVTYERVLPNGMTQEFARKYLDFLESRKKPITYRHFSPTSMGLPTDEVVR
ncbi:MAG: hypothetical protein ACYTBJ_00155 [Planctomycetota bacterium]|jgi:hypothetical protein